MSTDTTEPRTNNLRVIENVINDGRAQISVTVARLLIQEIKHLREARADAWDEAIAWAVADEREAWYPDEGYEANPYRKESV